MMNKLKVKGKHSEKDIVVSVDKDIPLRINLEMNKYSISEVIIDRNVFYLSDLYVGGLKKSNPYENLITTIQINFNPRYVDNINEPLIDKYYFRNEYGNILTNKIQIYQINVAKMCDIWYHDTYKYYPEINPLVILLGAIIWENEKIKFKKMIHSRIMDKKIGKIIEEEVFEMNSNLDFVARYYDSEESRIQEWEAEKKEYAKEAAREAREDGISIGIAKSILDFYNNGVSIDTILKATGLKEEEINDIINSQNIKK